MDELADKIRATGIAATVYNHTEWEEIAGQIAANYKNGNHAPIILIGHSLGADAVMFMAASLGKRGVPVALVVPFDGTQTLVAPSIVARVLNLTQRD
jgi:thioesterase domain-containing protein